MKKMIEVINDNLRSVVNGIKEHRTDAEKNLTLLKSDIDDKVTTASQYKTAVENSREIILSLETEISELEHDLEELKAKFGGKNFKELLAAGDKEINNKILEKRASITEQNSVILDITKKAHVLKKELARLKNQKEAVEEDLNKTIILEGYYEKRINTIIDFSVSHPEELATYKEIDEVDDLNTEEIDDIDINNIIDGQVFKEIDSISSGGDVDNQDVDASLNEVIEEKNPKVKEEKEELEPTTIKLEAINEEVKEAPKFIVEDTETDEESQDEIKLTAFEEEVKEETEEDDSETDSGDGELHLYVDDNLDNVPIDSQKIESGVSEHIKLHTMAEPPVTVNLDNLDNPLNADFIFSNNGYSDQNLKDCGLEEENFDPEDLKLLNSQFDKNNTLEFINVLEKHNLSKDKIYNSVSVLLNVTPQNLDKMLTMLESVAESSDIDYIFRYLDKVNVSKLEQNIALSDEEGLSELLVSALIEEKNADLSNLLDITDKEVNYIKKNSSDDYKVMVNFPEIVLANYNTLKSFNVDNAKDCIIKYPHRFIFNPSKFSAILDKYDPADLVRCINKNSAVIDKL